MCIASGAIAGLLGPGDYPNPVGPGNVTPLNNPTDENPVDYGVTGTNFGWTYNSWNGERIGSGARIVVGPTDFGMSGIAGNHKAMREDLDYGFHIEFALSNSAPGSSDFFIFSKHQPLDLGLGLPGDGREDRMFAISYTSGVTDGFNILVGDAGGGWSTFVSGLSAPLGDTIDFDVTYDASTPQFEFYWEGGFVGATQTGHGRYDLDVITIDSISGSGVTGIRNLQLGHVPEPATLALLALGGVALALRRRS
jgi:hypothetical protein